MRCGCETALSRIDAEALAAVAGDMPLGDYLDAEATRHLAAVLPQIEDRDTAGSVLASLEEADGEGVGD